MGFRRTVPGRLGYDLGWRYLRAMLPGVVALLGYGVLAFQPYLVRVCADWWLHCEQLTWNWR